MNEKRKSFANLDDEDALLNEAISCSRNLEIKTDDDDEEEELEAPKPPTIQHEKLWCDMTSDTSSHTSVLSLSGGKMDLSNDNFAVMSIKEEKSETVDEVMDIKCKVEDDLMEENTTKSNGRNCKRIQEDNDEDSHVPKNRRKSSSSSSIVFSTGASAKRPIKYETDPAALAGRQKDVDYGKNIIGYDRYVQEITKNEQAKDHLQTPPMHLKCNKRAWDGMVKLWRNQLHFWDPKDEQKVDAKDGPKMETDLKDENKVKRIQKMRNKVKVIQKMKNKVKNKMLSFSNIEYL